jgi:hypothetical protein
MLRDTRESGREPSIGYNHHMDKIKPFEKIASQFHISQESAKYFLNRVQKSFKTEKPPHKLILEFIEEKKLQSLPEPYDIAALMNESGVWAHALDTAPPIIVDDEDVDV